MLSSHSMENPEIWRWVVSQGCRQLLIQNLNGPECAACLHSEKYISSFEYKSVVNKAVVGEQVVELLDIIIRKGRFWVPLLQYLKSSTQGQIMPKLRRAYRNREKAIGEVLQEPEGLLDAVALESLAIIETEIKDIGEEQSKKTEQENHQVLCLDCNGHAGEEICNAKLNLSGSVKLDPMTTPNLAFQDCSKKSVEQILGSRFQNQAFTAGPSESRTPEKYNSSPPPEVLQLKLFPKTTKQEACFAEKSTKAITLNETNEGSNDQGQTTELDLLKRLLIMSDRFYSKLPLITSLPDSVQLKPTSSMLVFRQCPEESIVQVLRAIHRGTGESLDIELLECFISKCLPAVYAYCHSVDFNSCEVDSPLSEILSSNPKVKGLGFFGSIKIGKDTSMQNGICTEYKGTRVYNRFEIDLRRANAYFLTWIGALPKSKILDLNYGILDDTLITALCHTAQSCEQLDFHFCDFTNVSSESFKLIASRLRTRRLFFVFCNIGPTISSLFANIPSMETLFIWSSSLKQSNFLLSSLRLLLNLHCLEITINGYPFHQAQADSSVYNLKLGTLRVIFTKLKSAKKERLLGLAKQYKISFSTIQYWYNICSSINVDRAFTRKGFQRLLAYLKQVKMESLEIHVGGEFILNQSDIKLFLKYSPLKHLYIEPCFFPKSRVKFVKENISFPWKKWNWKCDRTQEGGLHFYC